MGDDSLYLGIRDGTDVSKRRPRGRGPARGVKKRTKRTKTGQRPRRPRRCMEGEGMSTSSELCQASLSSHQRHCSHISRPQWSFSNAKAEQGGSGHSTNEVLRGAERARQEKTSKEIICAAGPGGREGGSQCAWRASELWFTNSLPHINPHSAPLPPSI